MKSFVAVLAVAALAAAKPEAQFFNAAPWTGFNGANAYNGINAYNGLNAYNGFNAYNGLNAYNGVNAFGYSGLSPYGYSPVAYGLPQEAPLAVTEEKPLELVQHTNGAIVPEEPLANKLAKAAHFDAKAAVYANYARYAPYQHAAAATGYGYNRVFKREAESDAQYLTTPYSGYNGFNGYNAYTPYNFGYSALNGFNAYNRYNNFNGYPFAARAAYSPYGYGLNQLAYAPAQVAQAAKPLTYTLPKPVTYKIDEEQESPASTLRYITKRDADADAQYFNYGQATTPYTAAAAAAAYSGLYNGFSGYNNFPYFGYQGAYNGAYSAYKGLNAYSAYPGQYRPYGYTY